MKIWKSKGTYSNVVDIICPLIEIGLTDLPKFWGAIAPPAPRFRQPWLAWDNDDPAEIPNNVKQVDILPQMTSLCNNNFLPNPKLETYCF